MRLGKLFSQRDGNVEKTILRLTDNTDNAPAIADFSSLAERSHSELGRSTIVEILDNRLNDGPQYWRRLYKTVDAVHFLACNGSSDLVTDLRMRHPRIAALDQLPPCFSGSRDRADDVKRLAAKLSDLLTNEQLLASARHRARLLSSVDGAIIQPSINNFDISTAISEVKEVAVTNGQTTSIYTGLYTRSGSVQEVAIKVYRASSIVRESDTTAFMNVTSVLVNMRHNYIQPLLGVYVGLESLPAVVSPWCNNGDIITYVTTKSNPRLVRFKLIIQVLMGLEYLHAYSPTVVHGNIRSDNVLISDDGVARLADFASIPSSHPNSPGPERLPVNRLRWLAPERSQAVKIQPTPQGDIWTVACLALEVFSGLIPYHFLSDEQSILRAISRSVLPSRKSDCWQEAFEGGELWELLVECWDPKPLLRPSAFALQGSFLNLMGRKLAEWLRKQDPRVAFNSDIMEGIEFFFSTAVGRQQWKEMNPSDRGHFALILVLNSYIIMFAPARRPVAELGLADSQARVLAAACTALECSVADTYWTRPPITRLRTFASVLASSTPDLCDRVISLTSSPLIASITTPDTDISAISVGISGYDIVVGYTSGAVHLWMPGSDSSSFTCTSSVMPRNPIQGTGKCISVSPSTARVTAYSREDGDFLVIAIPGTGITAEEALPQGAGFIRAVCISQCARRVVAITEYRLLLWDADSQIMSNIPTSDLTSVAFSSDGQLVACGSRDGSVSVWNFARRLNVLRSAQGHTSAILAITFSSNSQLVLAGSHDCTIRLWRASTGERIENVLVGHQRTITCLASSPDGIHAASGSADGSIIIWNLTTFKAVGRLWAHRDASFLATCRHPRGLGLNTYVGEPAHQCHLITALAYSPTGRRLISGSSDGVIRLWDSTGAWRRYDSTSDVWREDVDFSCALMQRLAIDIQPAPSRIRRDPTILR